MFLNIINGSLDGMRIGDLSNSFSNGFIDFYSWEVAS